VRQVKFDGTLDLEVALIGADGQVLDRRRA
jgi:hypothetical protein